MASVKLARSCEDMDMWAKATKYGCKFIPLFHRFSKLHVFIRPHQLPPRAELFMSSAALYANIPKV